MNKSECALKGFRFEGTFIDGMLYGSGHINDTYCVNFKEEDGSKKRYILQKMNTEIFKNPEELMENIIGVTTWLRKKIIENGGNFVTSRKLISFL